MARKWNRARCVDCLWYLRRSMNMSTVGAFLASLSLHIIACFTTICYSVMAPFLYVAVEAKDSRNFEIGCIFASYAAGMLCTSLLPAKLLVSWGMKRSVVLATMGLAFFTVLFALLKDALQSEETLFFVAGITIRTMQGACSTWCDVAATAALVKLDVTRGEGRLKKVGYVDIMFGLGLMLGPVLGGIWYQYGSFGDVFYALSGCVAAVGILAMITVPAAIEKRVHPSQLAPPLAAAPTLWFSGENTLVSYSQVISSPFVLVSVLTCTISFGSLTFLQPTLGPHLHDSGYGHTSTTLVGALFSVPVVGYAVAVGATPYLFKVTGHIIPILVGLLGSGVGILIVASAFNMAPKSITSITAGLMVVGLGVGLALTPVAPAALHHVEHLGGGATQVVVDLISRAFTLGMITGPLIAGSLTTELSFAGVAVVMFLALGLWLIIVLITAVAVGKFRGCSWRMDDESDADSVRAPLYRPFDPVNTTVAAL